MHSMNRTQAMAAARKAFGPKALVRYNATAAGSDEERAALRHAEAEAKASGNRKAELKARFARIARRVEIGKRMDFGGMGAFFIEASGDNYADAVAKIKPTPSK